VLVAHRGSGVVWEISPKMHCKADLDRGKGETVEYRGLVCLRTFDIDTFDCCARRSRPKQIHRPNAARLSTAFYGPRRSRTDLRSPASSCRPPPFSESRPSSTPNRPRTGVRHARGVDLPSWLRSRSELSRCYSPMRSRTRTSRSWRGLHSRLPQAATFRCWSSKQYAERKAAKGFGG
jgi:hypothetical protein